MRSRLPPSIRVIAFDAVGTLIVPAEPVAEVYRRAAARQGVDIDLARIASRFRAALEKFGAQTYAQLDRPLDANSRVGTAGERSRWRRIVAEVLEPCADPERAFEELWNYFAQPTHWRVFADVAPVWSELRRRGLRIVIASNFDERLRAIQHGLPELSQCEQLFISSELGYIKPQPEFYHQVMQELSVHAGEILMVGDQHQNDVVAPRAQSWTAMRIDRQAASDNDTIASLYDLL
ncbi:MAG: HAD-IA family hydrolase [Planctomycetes bacterium]|nr:HAD-IA family hydrolase [Planctomycetota bacterium]